MYGGGGCRSHVRTAHVCVPIFTRLFDRPPTDRSAAATIVGAPQSGRSGARVRLVFWSVLTSAIRCGRGSHARINGVGISRFFAPENNYRSTSINTLKYAPSVMRTYVCEAKCVCHECKFHISIYFQCLYKSRHCSHLMHTFVYICLYGHRSPQGVSLIYDVVHKSPKPPNMQTSFHCSCVCVCA